MSEDLDDYYEEEYFDDYEDEYDEDEFSCDNCGPWCPNWMGDGLCELEIEAQAEMTEEYFEKHVRKAKCPVCGKELTTLRMFKNGNLTSF